MSQRSSNHSSVTYSGMVVGVSLGQALCDAARRRSVAIVDYRRRPPSLLLPVRVCCCLCACCCLRRLLLLMASLRCRSVAQRSSTRAKCGPGAVVWTPRGSPRNLFQNRRSRPLFLLAIRPVSQSGLARPPPGLRPPQMAYRPPRGWVPGVRRRGRGRKPAGAVGPIGAGWCRRLHGEAAGHLWPLRPPLRLLRAHTLPLRQLRAAMQPTAKQLWPASRHRLGHPRSNRPQPNAEAAPLVLALCSPSGLQ